MKRKRSLHDNTGGPENNKQPKSTSAIAQSSSHNAARIALSRYYKEVTTLREYLLSVLPRSSKWRCKRVAAIARYTNTPLALAEGESDNTVSQSLEQRRIREFSRLLDVALVGSFGNGTAVSPPQSDAANGASQDYARFTQRLRSMASGSTTSQGTASDACQSDVVDFVVGRLFYKVYPKERHPPHMLCHGYDRSFRHNLTADDQELLGGVMGLDCMFPNPYVTTLKSGAWQKLLQLVSREGDVSIMLDLLLNCGIFLPLETGKDNYYQVSGRLVSDLPSLAGLKSGANATQSREHVPRTPAKITFVRSRIMHGRPALNSFKETRFGLPHIHVLNRCKNIASAAETRHVAMYVFPRQFGLHNVLTSTVDRRESAHQFKDYTLREEEIRVTLSRAGAKQEHIPVPKRLKGPCMQLVRKLRILHQRCSFTELLRHYCSVPVLDQRTPKKQRRWRKVDESQAPLSTPIIEAARKSEKQDFVDFATPIASVSAYCRAVLANLIPSEFFGVGDNGLDNREMFMRSVHTFIESNRFEKATLHQVLQGQKIAKIPWLNFCRSTHKIPRTDFEKREELYLELLYFLIDSILIPLLRSTFHITESTEHGNQLFFFRHDVWRALTEPSIKEIRQATFRGVPKNQVVQLLKRRDLGVGQVRLVPKGAGVRMINNLRRRPVIQKFGKVFLGKSVNNQLEPVHCMLKCEKASNAAGLLGSLLSADEIHPRIAAFRERLMHDDNNSSSPVLYFAKVDVKSCFDTIPQQNLLKLIQRLCTEGAYSKHKHVELQRSAMRPRKFVSSARTLFDLSTFSERADSHSAAQKHGTVFAEILMDQVVEKEELMNILSEHVQDNVVRIGKKHFKQQDGIPQGSVLSTLLCSFFYADFEKRHLGYLKGDESLVLRLIDDFLLITTNRDHAVQFIEQMHDGCEEYGIQVRPEKTLSNFRWNTGAKGNITATEYWFPWCGVMIHTSTLQLSRDRHRRLAGSLQNAITVERTARPGASFLRKTLHAFRVQTSSMLLDLSVNTPRTVLTTLYLNFVETAMKMHRYIKTLKAVRAIDSSLIIGAIRTLSRLATTMTERQGQNTTLGSREGSGQPCAVSHGQIEWLLAAAFTHVLRRKQTRYRTVLHWLEQWRKRRSRTKDVPRLIAIARGANGVYVGYKF